MIDQIAKEAARKIWAECGEHSDYLDVKQMVAIIKAAIEKVMESEFIGLTDTKFMADTKRLDWLEENRNEVKFSIYINDWTNPQNLREAIDAAMTQHYERRP